jgi:hypothetical protein
MSYAKESLGLCEVVSGIIGGCSNDGDCAAAYGGSCDCIHHDARGKEWWVMVDPFSGIAFTCSMTLILDGTSGGCYEQSTPHLPELARAIGRTRPARRRPWKLRDVRLAVRDLKREAAKPAFVHLRRFAFKLAIDPRAAKALEKKPKRRRTR